MEVLISEPFMQLDYPGESGYLGEPAMSTQEVVERAQLTSDAFIFKHLGDKLPDYIVAYPGYYTNLTNLRDLYLANMSTPWEGEPVPELDLVAVERNLRMVIVDAIASPETVGDMLKNYQAVLDAKTATPKDYQDFMLTLEPYDQFADLEEETDEAEDDLLAAAVYDYEADDSFFDEEQADNETNADYQQRLRLARHMRKSRGIWKTAQLAIGQVLATKPFETEEEVLAQLAQDLEDIDGAVHVRLNGGQLDKDNRLHRQVKTISIRQIADNVEHLTGQVPIVEDIQEVKSSTPELRANDDVEPDTQVLKGYGTFNVKFGSK